MNRGFVTLGRFRGAPIRVHWSVLPMVFVFSWFRFAPGVWLGVLLILLVHELGHAVLVRARRLQVVEVQLHGAGGHCMHTTGSHYDSTIIAWGGVLAQMGLLLVGLIVPLVVPVESTFLAELLGTLISTNLFLAALNLVPYPALDGHLAWQLPKLWWQRRQRRRPPKSRPPKSATRRPLDGDAIDEARRIAEEALEKAKRH